MRYTVTVGERTLQVEVGPEGLLVDGRPVEADLRPIPGTEIRSLLLDGVSHRLLARRKGAGEWEIHSGGRRLPAQVLDERMRAIRAMTGAASGPAGPRPLRAPMPGLVIRVEVTVGQAVEPGQGLVIVEAMKMENELRADAAGTVKGIRVAAGEAVEKDQLLIEFETPDPKGAP